MRCLDPACTDRYARDQRERVLRFFARARAAFPHILLVAGNHEPYDGLAEATTDLLRRHLPGVTVLDDTVVEIGGLAFFGATLWSDFEGRSKAAMDRVRRRMGEYFFVKTRAGDPDAVPRRFQPEDALAAHDRSLAALVAAHADRHGAPLFVITHHAPSLLGLDPRSRGNGLDGAYASSLDGFIETLDNVPVWVHGHTHVATTYRIGATEVRSNALGFAAKGQAARGFSVRAHFDLAA